MSGEIDFSKGGYNGGDDENFFKPFTVEHMEYWWFFRELLRAGQEVKSYWQYSDGKSLADKDQKEFIALSLLNYAVHSNIIDAMIFHNDMQLELHRLASPFIRFNARRLWKASYSSLYSSFNALCNIVCVVAGTKSAFGSNPDKVWNYTPKSVIDLKKDVDLNPILEPFNRCRQRLLIRDHLDHFWPIWLYISPGEFKIDENFEKGYIALRPSSDVKPTVDADAQLKNNIFETMRDFDLIYKELSKVGGYLDKFLRKKGWIIDYSGYEPHNGQRPKTK